MNEKYITSEDKEIDGKLRFLSYMSLGIIVVGATLFGRYHQDRMDNDPDYRKQCYERRVEAHREIRRFTDNCKWCYGR